MRETSRERALQQLCCWCVCAMTSAYMFVLPLALCCAFVPHPKRHRPCAPLRVGDDTILHLSLSASRSSRPFRLSRLSPEFNGSFEVAKENKTPNQKNLAGW